MRDYQRFSCRYVYVDVRRSGSKKRSNMLSGTVPDLYYGQVLDNLALAVAKPDALPYFGLPAQGSTANTLCAYGDVHPDLGFHNRWIIRCPLDSRSPVRCFWGQQLGCTNTASNPNPCTEANLYSCGRCFI